VAGWGREPRFPYSVVGLGYQHEYVLDTLR
jgi:hypothetical protein